MSSKPEPSITIAGRKIGPGHPAFIVLELSCNHHQKKDEAFKLIDAAVGTGADAVKLQTYTADTMTIDSNQEWFTVDIPAGPASWNKQTLHDLYKQAYTPWEWQPELKKYAEKKGIILFSTPFDETAVDFLEKMDVPAYKIASYELLHVPLLRKVAKTGKPIIASVGFASSNEVEFAYNILKGAGAKEIALLHCITGYTDQPKAEDMNLATIADLSKQFNIVSGFSYNDAGIDFPVAAVKAGASIVEIHFILDRKLGGFDERFSSEPAEVTEMIKRIRSFESGVDKELTPTEESAIGEVHYGPVDEAEVQIEKYRRSICIDRDVKAGEEITPFNVRLVRSGKPGLSGMEWDNVQEKKFKNDFEKGTPLSWDLIGQ